jgi:hypothetical protein
MPVSFSGRRSLKSGGLHGPVPPVPNAGPCPLAGWLTLNGSPYRFGRRDVGHMYHVQPRGAVHVEHLGQNNHMLVSVPVAVAIPVAVAVVPVAIAVRAVAVTISVAGAISSRCGGSSHARRVHTARVATAVAVAAVVGIALIGALSVAGFAGGPNRVPIGNGSCRTVR